MLHIWHTRLEAIALLQIGLCLLGNIGVPLGANVAIALFTYMYTRNSEEVVVVGGIHGGSIIADIIMLCLHGSDWSSAGHEVAFGMSMMIINLFAKMGALGVMFMIYEETSGGSFVPSNKGGFSEIRDDKKDIADETGPSYQNE
mmetsp:Transcript_29674/g.41356  ORF Transcript_29674/g.41356 Transcript_29674/m.41356 type:complete len:144 (-) Transcript_29674:181-612(-)|eukprot:CAMPEP_0185262934 /NCGR_PEP_ID=MMETSP1359-20130426/10949_1 /TAXON_ID=552665 /ORGANISM="Bigelowiella longifila, Strain CCMP242" /LENGTH=143 /DNA_ID=CAMNT_0027850005 /DNA_START=39 /DNA_END=470 /DNA_ORIENTATION=-